MERKGDVWFRIHRLNKKRKKKGGGRAIGEVGNLYFFSLHSRDKICAAAAIYLHGEVMLDIYYNDLYKEIHFDCFTVLFCGKKDG